MPTAAQQCISVLKKNRLRLALAESVTAGLAAHELAGIFGTSEVLTGSVVCYHQDVKARLLQVPERIIRQYSCESMEVTERLARNLKKLMAADVYAAVTGLASPGGSENTSKPVGTVFICVMYKKKIVRLRFRFYGSPLQVRKKAVHALLKAVAGTARGLKSRGLPGGVTAR